VLAVIPTACAMRMLVGGLWFRKEAIVSATAIEDLGIRKFVIMRCEERKSAS
jgi:hypothetical protein